MSLNNLNYSAEPLANSILLIKVAGELDMYNSGQLREYFKKLRHEGWRRFIFDFQETEYLDSSGIGLLVNIFLTAEHRNMPIRYINFSPGVRHLITLTRLETILPIKKNLADAVKDIEDFINKEIELTKGIFIDDNSPLLKKKGTEFIELNLPFNQIRRLSMLIAQKAPSEVRELNLLEQQISELLKNAVKHGNRLDPNKKIRIWYSFNNHSAHLIIEDEGEGFKQLEEWNEFYKKKLELHRQQNYDKLLNYLSFRTERSDNSDGGNALFAAVEYWNGGIVFNNRRNCVGVKRYFYNN